MRTKLKQTSDIIRNLNALKARGWNAIIAGSAIRDIYHDKPVTAVDILIREEAKMVQYKSKKWEEYWLKMFDCNDNTAIEFLGDKSAFSNLNKHLSAVWQIILGGKSYQIILLDMEPIEYVNKYFDFGICRAYCDGVKMRFTNEFIKDSMNHNITLYKEYLSPEQLNYACKQHINRIQKKYPGWTPVLDQ